MAFIRFMCDKEIANNQLFTPKPLYYLGPMTILGVSDGCLKRHDAGLQLWESSYHDDGNSWNREALQSSLLPEALVAFGLCG